MADIYMRAVRPEYREVVEWVRDRLQIARAFLTSEPTIAQRIVRAKRRLAGKQVPFEVPRGRFRDRNRARSGNRVCKGPISRLSF